MPASSAQSRTRPRKAAAPTFQAPLMEAPPQPKPDQPERPAQHNGVAVEREELISALPNGRAPFRFTKLFLRNGETAFGCRDCVSTADSRGQILLHRNEAHGARNGKKPPRATAAPPLERGEIDPVLPPRGDNTPAPSNPLAMTLGEFLSLAPTLAAMGDLVDRLEAERDKALAMLGSRRADQHKIDVYEAHREELIELRLQTQKWADYDEIKDELQQLRAWKKKTITRLRKAGFQLAEGDM